MTDLEMTGTMEHSPVARFRRPKWRRWWAGILGLVAVLGWLAMSGGSSNEVSVCFGSSASGALRNAWKLPLAGPNFRAYSPAGWLMGRTFVHSVVHEVVLDAYAQLAASHPDVTFIYGETAHSRGGRLRPHRTHQNGLAVDFMVPVTDERGRASQLPTSLFAKFGYGNEFDDAGAQGELRIDFEAIAAHLAALERSAAKHHVGIRRVIFEAPLRARLRQTKAWSEIANLAFMREPAWIRHDEHYHVDFDVPCRALSELE